MALCQSDASVVFEVKRYPLSDKVVLITGGGRGLGAATAAALSQRGARLVLADIDVSAAQKIAATLPTHRGLALQCDVTNFNSVQDAVRQTLDEFGRIDVAIANAGVLGRGGTFRTLTPDQVSGVMSVNVDGVVNTVAATLESVISSRGQIVLVSSVFAYINGAGAIPYAMSKAAVEQLGRGLGVELARHGASAMTAYFSLIETDMIRQGVDADPTCPPCFRRCRSSSSSEFSRRLRPPRLPTAWNAGNPPSRFPVAGDLSLRFEAWQDRPSTRNSPETPAYGGR
jgi:NAD(P)-dependent dehydrogenase (short-subunit alcohol dehydrogenase family)